MMNFSSYIVIELKFKKLRNESYHMLLSNSFSGAVTDQYLINEIIFNKDIPTP